MSKTPFFNNNEKIDSFNSNYMESIQNKYKEKTTKLISTLFITIPLVSTILNAQIYNQIEDINLSKYYLNIKHIKENGSSELNDVFKVNNYVNSFKYKTDMENYGKKEYYASPLEMIKKQSGDCEDYAILKYNILVNEFGLDKNKFKFIFGMIGKNNEPHILLSYKDNDKEFYLDNTIKNRMLESNKHQNFKKLIEIKDDKMLFNDGVEKEINANHKYSKLLKLSLPINFSESLINNKDTIQLTMNDR